MLRKHNDEKERWLCCEPCPRTMGLSSSRSTSFGRDLHVPPVLATRTACLFCTLSTLMREWYSPFSRYFDGVVSRRSCSELHLVFRNPISILIRDDVIRNALLSALSNPLSPTKRPSKVPFSRLLHEHHQFIVNAMRDLPNQMRSRALI